MARENTRQRFQPNLGAIARYLGCSERTVQRRMKRPGCPILSLGHNKVVVTADALDRWLADLERQSA
jgi:AraC-like DNA-binding protein